MPPAHHKNLDAVYKNYANNLTEGVQDFKKKKKSKGTNCEVCGIVPNVSWSSVPCQPYLRRYW